MMNRRGVGKFVGWGFLKPNSSANMCIVIFSRYLSKEFMLSEF